MTGDLSCGLPALVVVHGGPGSTHDYLLRLTELAKHGWPVVHYDQLGNGGSTHLPERGAEFWTVELFEAELDNLVSALALDSGYVLFGQSWGGPLAALHSSRKPDGLRGLVIANAPASYEDWLSEMAVLRALLPRDVQETLVRHEDAGTTDTDAYFAAMRVFYDRHVCRVQPWPRDFMSSFMEIYNDPTVYYTMNGPNEFHVIGTLRDWSVVPHLRAIDTPTLLMNGRHDEATPVTMQPFADHIAGAEWTVFENSSHLPHLEEPERFDEVMLGFLKSVS
ncbi:proline iminopeptidase-family hydrolase [Rhodococcus sp. 14-2470-1a]|uniref:proline iminopeptidase-family hydrolase n=1 Tax=Rhodococcus sp. 14-2470-1a TaxID=2023150 RepID=UPI00359405C9